MLAGSVARCSRRCSRHRHHRRRLFCVTRNLPSLFSTSSFTTCNTSVSKTRGNHNALCSLLTRRVRPFAAMQRGRWNASDTAHSHTEYSGGGDGGGDPIAEMARPIACISLTHSAIRSGINGLSMSIAIRKSRDTRRRMLELDRVTRLLNKQEAYALQNGPMIGLKEGSTLKDEMEMVKHTNYRNYLALQRAKQAVIAYISAVDDSDQTSDLLSATMSDDESGGSFHHSDEQPMTAMDTRLYGMTHDTSEEEWKEVAKVVGQWSEAYLMHLSYKDTEIVPSLLMKKQPPSSLHSSNCPRISGAQMKKILDIDRDELNAFQAPWIISQLSTQIDGPKKYEVCADYIQAVQFSSSPEQYLLFVAWIKRYLPKDFWYRIETARHLDQAGKQ